MSLSRFLLKIIPSSFLKEDDATQKKSNEFIAEATFGSNLGKVRISGEILLG
ncbi:hypothetical protein I8L28_001224 [Escherichia coli]|nr:hypothetical protein [Escherichia coli]